MPKLPPKELNSESDLWTPPFDPRFPNQNQSRYCYQNFLDFHRCQNVKGKNYEPCEWFRRVYLSMCPTEWHLKWTEQIENGNFAGNIDAPATVKPALPPC